MMPRTANRTSVLAFPFDAARCGSMMPLAADGEFKCASHKFKTVAQNAASVSTEKRALSRPVPMSDAAKSIMQRHSVASTLGVTVGDRLECPRQHQNRMFTREKLHSCSPTNINGTAKMQCNQHHKHVHTSRCLEPSIEGPQRLRRKQPVLLRHVPPQTA